MRSRSGWVNRTKAPSSARGLRILYTRYQSRAKFSNTYFDLTLEQFNAITKKLCAYCERGPSQKCGHYVYNGIDRIDNARGYTDDNSAACCWECNRIKGSDISAKEMRTIGAVLREIRAKRPKG